jgi:hypothetical protein
MYKTRRTIRLTYITFGWWYRPWKLCVASLLSSISKCVNQSRENSRDWVYLISQDFGFNKIFSKHYIHESTLHTLFLQHPYRGLLPRGLKRPERRVKLTSHLHIVPRLRMSESATSSPPHAFKCTGASAIYKIISGSFIKANFLTSCLTVDF